MFTAVAAGIIAGSAHVLSGPDHMAAVAPLAGSEPRRALRTGGAWGLGHTTGTWSLALLALALREMIDVEALSHWGERVVGVVLIGIGLWGLHRLFVAPRLSGEAHSHKDEIPRGSSAAFGVGMLHGVAGTSHLLGMLPALAFESGAAALAYVIAYGLSGIAAMMGFSWGIGAALSRVPASRARIRTGLRGALS
ncbi:MAG: High-affinity nickel transporter, partial [Chrysiogenetes bacterium]|nr:High-affinity nickel transporter [Chrysiogenetes bacterium]